MKHFRLISMAILVSGSVLWASMTRAQTTSGVSSAKGAPQGPVSSGSQTLLLWPAGAPGAKGDKDRDKPSITAYFPGGQATNRAAVVICPGGAYSALMMTYEGRDVARWLNGLGVVGIVLQYRVSPYRHPAPMADGQRAMRLVRARAAEWGIDPNRIGIMGFSAGGHVASTVGTHFDGGDPKAADPVDRESCRPDFMVLVYPVITMGEKCHAGSRASLLGGKPSAADIELLSNEKHVNAETPPAFLAHARTDRSVPVENSAMLFSALQAHKVPAEFLELPEGAHGLGCGQGKLWAAWQAKCAEWLKARGIVGEGK